jgi:5-methylcytosine-specific restriction endonuclease McrA
MTKKSKDFPEWVRKAVKERSDNCCEQCGKLGYEIHHIVTKGRGGYGTLENALHLCVDCHDFIHTGKGADLMKIYIEMRTEQYGEGFWIWK